VRREEADRRDALVFPIGPYRWRVLNLCTMRQIGGTAATLRRAETAAEAARGKIGHETDLIVAEVLRPAGVVFR
jgi:hypothetical protein